MHATHRDQELESLNGFVMHFYKPPPEEENSSKCSRIFGRFTPLEVNAQLHVDHVPMKMRRIVQIRIPDPFVHVDEHLLNVWVHSV